MKSTMVRTVASLALAGAAASAVSLATAGSAQATGRGPQPITNRLTTVTANTPSWVNIFWRTDRPVCNARISVDGGREVAVSYRRPGRFTAFTTGDTLRPGRTAITQIQVTPMRRVSGLSVLRTTMTYNDCGRHARTQFTRASLVLPVIRTIRPGHPTQPGHPGQPGHPVRH
ncbi:hypothetical protein GCM10010172_51880 [Paractinoplanes ferrugineus]|uniref:Uncharacterized protein n=1 Tax=Paractinoplanes ferrugineus TaxID=113564 RepID=A0A919J148_9ACTN|nr:hypothetical protein [Actinoplanes ferrugineus]GIE11993.1 hypothetical protein Afe05nite_38330 [Actinoplanes ferrugineus]